MRCNMVARRACVATAAAGKVEKSKRQALNATDPTRASHAAALQAHTNANKKFLEATKQMTHVSECAGELVDACQDTPGVVMAR